MPDKPAAKQGDKIVAVDTHVVMVPSPGGPVPTPMPMPFKGTISGSLSASVLIADMAAAVVGSTATNDSPHVPQGGPFQKPPSNQATIQTGSAKVLIHDKPVALHGDAALTCNDPTDAPKGKVVASGKVLVGS